jgi:hypothetical protein
MALRCLYSALTVTQTTTGDTHEIPDHRILVKLKGRQKQLVVSRNYLDVFRQM